MCLWNHELICMSIGNRYYVLVEPVALKYSIICIYADRLQCGRV